MICDILVTLTVKIVVTALWDVMLRSSVDRYKYFEEPATSAFMVEEIATWGKMVCVDRE
jgi:hypothetical protein